MSGLPTWSELLGYTSIACWLGAQFPQVLENIRRQSCAGLALPFLANWLLGDFSNLIGCILTHQLPFQTWLATYFVFVDCVLVIQYFYYPHDDKTLTSHGRSTSSVVRRMSTDRGPSRYRTLSAAAANVAAAAALAAEIDEHSDRRRSRGRWRRRSIDHMNANSEFPSAVVADGEDDSEYTALADSFHSEGGHNIGRTRFTWNGERSGRGESVGATIGPGSFTDILPPVTGEALATQTTRRGRSLQRGTTPDLEASHTATQRRSSRASRRGATMVFLGVWALFGIGTFTSSNRGFILPGPSPTGKVLSVVPLPVISTIPISGPIPALSIPTTLADPNEGIPDTLPPVRDHPGPHKPSTERILGRIFAWLCTTLYLTSRLPQIWKNYTRKSVEGLSMYLFVFAFLGNVFYVSSIVSSPQMHAPSPISSAFVRESIPYLLGSAGTLMFDITIVTQSFIYRPRRSRWFGQGTAEEASLLAGDTLRTQHNEPAMVSRGRTTTTKAHDLG